MATGLEICVDAIKCAQVACAAGANQMFAKPGDQK